MSEKPKWLGFFSGILEAAGYVVVYTTSIPQSARELGSGTLDIVITDLSCIAADAFTLIEAAKQHGVPALVISRDIARLFRQPYADLYLEPPILPQELLAVLKELLRCHRPGEEVSAVAALA